MGDLDAEMAAAIEERIRPLRARYVDLLHERTQELERVIGLFSASSPHLDQDRAMLLAIAHTLSGTGAIYGFPEISRAAKAVEDAMLAGHANGDPLLLTLVLDLTMVCRQVQARHRGPS